MTTENMTTEKSKELKYLESLEEQLEVIETNNKYFVSGYFKNCLVRGLETSIDNFNNIDAQLIANRVMKKLISDEKSEV